MSLVILDINLVAKNNKWEVVWIVWICLNKEFVPPAVKCLEALGTIDVVYKYAAISTAIERDT